MSRSAQEPPVRPRAPEPAAGEADGGSLLDMLRQGVLVLDTDGRIVLWSPRATEILGWSDHRAVARPLAEFTPGGRDAETTVAAMLRGLPEQDAWRGQLPLRHLDGHTVELECRASLVTDPAGSSFVLVGLVETGRLHSVEQDLAALDALFSSSPLGIALFDAERRFTRVNDSLAALYGGTAQSLLGHTVLEVLPTRIAHQLYELQGQVLETGRPVVDLVALSPDRSGASSISLGRLIDRSGRVIGISSVIIDITERREAMERTEQARQRLALLDDVGTALGDRLDVRLISEALAHVLVPRFADYAAVYLRKTVEESGELPPHQAGSDAPLRMAGSSSKRAAPEVDQMLDSRQGTVFPADSVFGRVLATGHPWMATSRSDMENAGHAGDPRLKAALDLGIHSVMILPLRARGTILGLLVVARSGQRAAYTDEDFTLAREVASRAGVSIDNARLYARERESALMLQRSLLPHRVAEPPGLEIAYRYVPGSTVAEVGGDWFDVIPLSHGRTALVVGDVMGHGLRAAATMGRLRTAVRTLAGLDLPPAELLRRVNDLSDDLAQGPDDSVTATCVYAVYDPGSHTCTLAKAGHVPPVLLTRAANTGHWHAEPIEMEHEPPLGVFSAGDQENEYQEREIPVPEGSVLALYTDGLVERRDEDLDHGVGRLCTALSRTRGATPSLEEICDTVVEQLSPASGPDGAVGADDIALLTARLGGLPEDASASWTFAAQSQAVRRARAMVRHTLRQWGLDPLTDTAVLLVSELVTNAVRYARGGPVRLRLLRGVKTLAVEVHDPLPTPPTARTVGELDEGGRGLHLVGRSAYRWGTRQSPAGKVVWFELRIPSL